MRWPETAFAAQVFPEAQGRWSCSLLRGREASLGDLDGTRTNGTFRIDEAASGGEQANVLQGRPAASLKRRARDAARAMSPEVSTKTGSVFLPNTHTEPPRETDISRRPARPSINWRGKSEVVVELSKDESGFRTSYSTDLILSRTRRSRAVSKDGRESGACRHPSTRALRARLRMRGAGHFLLTRSRLLV